MPSSIAFVRWAGTALTANWRGSSATITMLFPDGRRGTKVREDNLQGLIALGIQLGIEPLEFCTAPDFWRFDKYYCHARKAGPPMPEVRARFFVDHETPLLGRRLSSPIGISAGVGTGNPSRIQAYLKLGVGFVTTKTFVLRERYPRHFLHFVTDPDLITPVLPPDPSTTLKVLFRSTCAHRGTLIKGNGDALSGYPHPASKCGRSWVRRLTATISPNQLVIVSIAVDSDGVQSPQQFVDRFRWTPLAMHVMLAQRQLSSILPARRSAHTFLMTVRWSRSSRESG